MDELTLLCVKTASRFENNGYHPGEAFTKFVTRLGDLAHVIEVRRRGRLVASGVRRSPDRRDPLPHLNLRRRPRGGRQPQPLRRAVRRAGPARPAAPPCGRSADPHLNSALFTRMNNAIYNVGFLRFHVRDAAL
ncbi:hypothetical protein Lesp01_01980 [Lentzea sp. NBRC 102530]|nr:hypothetical protein Lesp01_01980 [Lentzea sp. NBRC 102530]